MEPPQQTRPDRSWRGLVPPSRRIHRKYFLEIFQASRGNVSEQIITAIAAAIGSAVLFHLCRSFLGRLYVRRITSSADSWVPQLVELYGQTFPADDGTNYCMEEITDIMDSTFESDRHVEVENIILAAICKKEVVGFIFCHLYPERRKAIISYFTIDKDVPEARHKGAKVLIENLKRILVSGSRCDILFFDLQGVVPETPISERRHREARRVRFKQSAKSLGMKTREFLFPYLCPRLSLSDDTKEFPFALFGIGIGSPIPDKIPKEQIIEYLKFIYLDCYGDMYSVSDPRFKEHHAYLEGLVAEYETSLPNFVQVI